MKSWKTGIFLAIIVVFFCGSGNADTQFNLKRPLLIIGWDAAEYGLVRKMCNEGELPNLKNIVTQGAFVETLVEDHETCTKPGWTQICTGLPASKTGVYSNDDFRPFKKGSTIFEIIRNVSKKRVFTVFTGAKDHHLGSLGPAVEWMNFSGDKMSSGPGEPWSRVKGSFDIWYGDKHRMADEVGKLVLKLLDDYGTSMIYAMFIHFGDIDDAGHDYGEGSQEYAKAIKQCDNQLGKILAKLESIGSKPVIVVVSDHGFDKGQKTHFNAPDALFAVNDILHQYHDGSQIDVAPSILKLLGVPKKFWNHLPGKPLFE
jgi:predicted AlkP superfamily pyrophosphatase or phosphodiesterase